MLMSKHGNSPENDKPHHLYQMWDHQEEEVYKYGISAEPIAKDGLSKRVRVQLGIFNAAANFLRFAVSILLFNISGRLEARRLEDQYIDDFEEKHSRKPSGNPRGGTKNKRKDTPKSPND